MAQAVVELHGHIGEPSLLKGATGPGDPLAHIAHRVLVPGDQEHREGAVHPADVFLLREEGDAPQHIPHESQGGVLAAHRIGDIGVHIVGIGANPVKLGAGGGEALVIGAKDQRVRLCAVGAVAQPPDLPVYDLPPGGDEQRGLMAGTAEDGAANLTGVTDQIGAGDEGAHGVSEEEVGDAGKYLGRPPLEGVQIVHHVRPAVLLAKVDPGLSLRHGETVSQVVMGHHRKPIGTEEPGKGRIAPAVLRHAVGNLHYAADRPGDRRPLVDMEQRYSVAGWLVIFRGDRHKKPSSNLYSFQIVPIIPLIAALEQSFFQMAKWGQKACGKGMH